ncbi:hypothetical protein ACP70R_000183 [Stipagrostis hirtigluma subsp. patula]
MLLSHGRRCHYGSLMCCATQWWHTVLAAFADELFCTGLLLQSSLHSRQQQLEGCSSSNLGNVLRVGGGAMTASRVISLKLCITAPHGSTLSVHAGHRVQTIDQFCNVTDGYNHAYTLCSAPPPKGRYNCPGYCYGKAIWSCSRKKNTSISRCWLTNQPNSIVGSPIYVTCPIKLRYQLRVGMRGNGTARAARGHAFLLQCKGHVSLEYRDTMVGDVVHHGWNLGKPAYCSSRFLVLETWVIDTIWVCSSPARFSELSLLSTSMLGDHHKPLPVAHLVEGILVVPHVLPSCTRILLTLVDSVIRNGSDQISAF